MQSLHCLHRVGVITVCQNAECSRLGKLMEGFFNGIQILEIVKMIRFNIQDNSQRGIEIKERITVFTALQNDGIPIPHPVSGMEQGQITTDHHGGVQIGFHHNMGHHGGGSGLAVGAGNTDSIVIGLHDLSPGLRTFKHRNTLCTGSGYFRVIIMRGGCADNAVRAADVLRPMTYGHINASGNQFIGGNRGIHIRSCNKQAHPLQDKPQRPHGHAANANQMNVAARLEIIFNQFTLFRHGISYLPIVDSEIIL